MRKIYALKGRHDSGKTTTLKLLNKNLKSKYPMRTTIYEDGNVDITVVMDINGQKIGIASGGDTQDIVLHNLKRLTSDKYKCDIIFCATRSRGKTIDAVKSYSSTHSIHFECKQPDSNDDSVVVERLIELSGL